MQTALRWATNIPIEQAKAAKREHPENATFYDGRILSFEGARQFMRRYAALAHIKYLLSKFNQILYLRTSGSLKYFTGVSIGFNIAIGGQNDAGESAENELRLLFLRAQEHLLLP